MTHLNVVLSTHVNEIPGIAYYWTEFLKRSTNILLVVKHPLHEWLINHPIHDIDDGAVLYVHQESIFTKRFPKIRMPYLIAKARDALFSLYYTIKAARQSKCMFDIFIGIDCLNAFAGIVLRKLGITKRVIFYPVEYATNRFDDRLKNLAYQKLVQYATRHSDLVWNVSSRIARYSNQFTVSGNKNLIVPHGYNPPPLEPKIDFSLNPKHKKLVYVGGLGPEVGLPLVLKSLPEIIKRVPDVRLYVIGHGSKEHLNALERLTRLHKLEQHVHYLGVLPNEKVLDFLRQCDVGIATISPMPSWARFADMSMKVKEYLACGLPVVTTDVVGQGEVIRKNQAGVTIDFTVKEMVEATVRLLTDKTFYKKCQANTRSLVTEFTWKRITQNSWNKTLDLLKAKARD